MEDKFHICIGYDEDLGKGLSCMHCFYCGENHLTQETYKKNFLEKLKDKIFGEDVRDFTDKKLGVSHENGN